MSDLDKMMAFGHWLSERRVYLTAELCSLAADRTKPVDAIRLKAGHLENMELVLRAFKDLYNGDLNKFLEEYLGRTPEPEESDGDSSSPS